MGGWKIEVFIGEKVNIYEWEERGVVWGWGSDGGRNFKVGCELGLGMCFN